MTAICIAAIDWPRLVSAAGGEVCRSSDLGLDPSGARTHILNVWVAGSLMVADIRVSGEVARCILTTGPDLVLEATVPPQSVPAVVATWIRRLAAESGPHV